MSDRVVHFEIPADDLERAKTFYSETFGWNLQQWPGFDYVMVTTTPANEQGTPSEPGGINGGMLLRQGPITNPIVTIEVADMEAALQTVADKGGRFGTRSRWARWGSPPTSPIPRGTRSDSGRTALRRVKYREPGAAC